MTRRHARRLRQLCWVVACTGCVSVFFEGCRVYDAGLKKPGASGSDDGASGEAGTGPGDAGSSGGGAAGQDAGNSSGATSEAGAAGVGASDAGGAAGAAGEAGAGEAGTGEAGAAGAGGASGGGASGAGGTGAASGAAGGSGAGGVAGGGAGGGGASGVGGGGMGTVLLIDNFDDLNNQNLIPLGGYWYSFNDGTAGAANVLVSIAAPPADPLNTSTGALHMVGSMFTGFGVGAGVDFLNQGVQTVKPSASIAAYTAVRFRAKVAVNRQLNMTIAMPSVYSDPAGMQCNPAASPPPMTGCFDHFQTVTPIMLTTSWATHTVPFSDLSQRGFGLPQPADWKTKVYAIQFTQPCIPASVDVWIDDVTLIP